MTVIPFVCLGIGIAAGMKCRNKTFLTVIDRISTAALILLMFVIGFGMGDDENILKQFPMIGLDCIIIALTATGCSVICTYICERTLLPIEKINGEVTQEKTGTSSLVWIMPGSIVIGIIFGFVLNGKMQESCLDKMLTVSLMVLYVCVGISQGATEGILRYLKALGLRILFLPMAVLVGRLVGGILASVLFHIKPEASILAASGMSFYSITGAYMTQSYGIEIGTYGFIVNVLRETFTVLLLPLLIKISPGSAIAGGAAGDMDTMLAPITKFVGPRLSLITLLTGTVLTLAKRIRYLSKKC